MLQALVESFTRSATEIEDLRRYNLACELETLPFVASFGENSSTESQYFLDVLPNLEQAKMDLRVIISKMDLPDSSMASAAWIADRSSYVDVQSTPWPPKSGTRDVSTHRVRLGFATSALSSRHGESCR
jgi:hypothetical protein